MSDTSGRNLIFVISQPRSGSTLLQRILGGHPDIHTLSEPWVMLPPLAGLDPDYRAPGAMKPAWNGVRSFIAELPEGQDDYLEGVRRMYSHLYDRALVSSGKRFFLDKTPRYYTIIQALARVFPEARFIFLFRQPLAVCSSILNRFDNKESRPQRSRADLLDAPQLLLEGVKLLGERGLEVHYESLAGGPETEVRRVCDWLGIAYQPEIIAYGAAGDQPVWRMGDPRVIYENIRPITDRLDGWIGQLGNPQHWRCLDDYLRVLGEETISRMGYRFDEMGKTLEAHRPSAGALARTIPLADILRGIKGRTSVARRVLTRILGPSGGRK